MVPNVITQLINLQWLDLSRNQLTAVPNTIDQLANLQTLILGDNQLMVLPSSIVKTNLPAKTGFR
jgi:Leucine-rich repeat (LRR) protein